MTTKLIRLTHDERIHSEWDAVDDLVAALYANNHTNQEHVNSFNEMDKNQYVVPEIEILYQDKSVEKKGFRRKKVVEYELIVKGNERGITNLKDYIFAGKGTYCNVSELRDVENGTLSFETEQKGPIRNDIIYRTIEIHIKTKYDSLEISYLKNHEFEDSFGTMGITFATFSGPIESIVKIYSEVDSILQGNGSSFYSIKMSFS